MILREATISDAAIIQSLRRKLLKYQHSVNPIKDCSENRLEHSDELVKIYLSRPYSVMYLAYLDESSVGFVHGTIDYKPTTDVTAYVQDLFVLEEHRGQGIGSALLRRLHSYFEEHDVIWGLTTDVTPKNKTTVDFYAKNGYALVHEKDGVGYFVITR